MRTWIIICLSVGLMSSTGIKDKNKDFKLISASIQTSYGGAAGSGSVSTYTMRLKALRSFTLICDSGYGAGRRSELYIMQDSFHQASTLKVRRGQIIRLRFSIRDAVYMGGGDHQFVLPGSDSSALPIKSATGVAIRYRGGKNKVMAINKLQIETPIFAP